VQCHTIFLTIHQQDKRYFSNQLKNPVLFLCVSMALRGVTEIPPPPWDFAAENRRRGGRNYHHKSIYTVKSYGFHHPAKSAKRNKPSNLENGHRSHQPVDRQSRQFYWEEVASLYHKNSRFGKFTKSMIDAITDTVPPCLSSRVGKASISRDDTKPTGNSEW
jgi:hypothetical protein